VTRTVLAGLLLLVSAAGFQKGVADYIDPVGKWTYSTKSETGDPATGTLEITGTPGAYAGKIISSEGREITIVDVLTSPTSIIIVADLPEGGAVVVRGVRDASGKITGAWGPVRPVIPVTLERAR
jgi:hypothetical protein